MLRVGSKQLFHNQHTEVSISVSFMNLHVKAQVIMKTCTSVSLSKLSQNFVWALRRTPTNCVCRVYSCMYVSFIDLFIRINSTNSSIVFLLHTNAVNLLKSSCSTITEPGLPVNSIARQHNPPDPGYQTQLSWHTDHSKRQKISDVSVWQQPILTSSRMTWVYWFMFLEWINFCSSVPVVT